MREYLRALNLKPSSKHVRQAIESFGRDLPEAEYSKMFGMLVTLKDRFGRKREYHFLNQFWRWHNIELVYPEFNQHPELLGQVTMGTYTPELDRALTENNIKLWKLTSLMIETDVPNGPDKATLRVPHLRLEPFIAGRYQGVFFHGSIERANKIAEAAGWNVTFEKGTRLCQVKKDNK